MPRDARKAPSCIVKLAEAICAWNLFWKSAGQEECCAGRLNEQQRVEAGTLRGAGRRESSCILGSRRQRGESCRAAWFNLPRIQQLRSSCAQPQELLWIITTGRAWRHQSTSDAVHEAPAMPKVVHTPAGALCYYVLTKQPVKCMQVVCQCLCM